MWAAEGQVDSVAQWQYSPPPPLPPLRRHLRSGVVGGKAGAELAFYFKL